MLTLDTLKAYGANTEEGLARCMNMEPFYIKIVGMVLADGNFDKLRQAVAAKDAEGAFAAAHALKGATGNASLTPMYEPVCALTERLRGKSGDVVDEECERLAAEILNQYDHLKALA